jgi:SET domain-containing protein
MKVIITFVVLLIIVSVLTFKIGYNAPRKPLIEVKKSKIHNKGVFANYDIKKGDLVEKAPYIIITDKKGINDYVYLYTKNNTICLVFGYGSIYNHSTNNNINFYVDPNNHNFEYYANRDIKKGEELLVTYGKEYWTSRNIKPKL